MRALLASIAACGLLSGCGIPVEGRWIGTMVCNGFQFNVEMTLEQDKGLVLVGEGQQERRYPDPEDPFAERIDRTTFDVEAEMASGKAEEQELDTEMTCTSDVLIIERGTDSETLEEECQGGRYDGYVLTWDGDEEMAIEGPDGCAGTLALR